MMISSNTNIMVLPFDDDDSSGGYGDTFTY